MLALEQLRVRIFADGADLATMIDMSRRPWIHGFTTNPTLLRKCGVRSYRAFAKELVQCIRQKPISFEVCSDDFEQMERQAMEIAGWSDNVYVKIPVTDTQGRPSHALLAALISRQVKVNVTAIMTLNQVQELRGVLRDDVPSFVSVFAGRIADTGRDPLPIVQSALHALRDVPSAKLIWASPRELLNIFQADASGCHVITVTNDILQKIPKIGYDLGRYSLDTVKMFYDDAVTAGFADLQHW